MNLRKPISKKIRFEVFKRDRFTCQYCGQKAPDVLLHVDHINPVSNGGENNIFNYVTSCFDCNMGKKDRLLDDNVVLQKQRLQLEIVQEKREQIELMFQWKESLNNIDDETNELVFQYINNKIKPLYLSESYKTPIVGLLKKFGLEKVLDGIDESAAKYLKFDNDEEYRKSAENFLERLGGVIVYKDLPPISRKLSYIKGIAKNRFKYFDTKKASIILNIYVKSLLDYGLDENKILNDLESEVQKMTIESKSWSEWKQILESWTLSIQNWEKKVTKSLVNTLPFNEKFDSIVNRLDEYCLSIEYIGNSFLGFNNKRYNRPLALNNLMYITSIE